MNATLSATHLLRQFVLFALVVVCLSLLIRAGYALWQFPLVEAGGEPLQLFLTGLRFDLSLVGMVCLVPMVLGPLLAMFDATRALAKVLVWLSLVGGLALLLLAELVTPALLLDGGARPDAATLADLPGLVRSLSGFTARYPLPSAIGALLAVLILVAFVARLESGRFLRYRLSRASAVALALLGGLACLAVARSRLDPFAPMLSRDEASLGGPPLVDELATNSAWTVLRPLLAPLF